MFKPVQSGQHWDSFDHLLVSIGRLCIGMQEKELILPSGEAVAVFQNMEIWIAAACELLLHFVTQERMNKLHLLCIPGFGGVRMHLLFTFSVKNVFCEIYASNCTLFTILWKLPCLISVQVFFSSTWKMLLHFELPVSKEGSQLKNQRLLIGLSQKHHDVIPVLGWISNKPLRF